MNTFFTTAYIAWRNLKRNRRRTLLTLLTISAGCGMIIFNNALFKGGTDQMIEDAVALNSGHIQVHEKGYLDNRTNDYAFAPSEKLKQKLHQLKQEGIVEGYTERVEANAMVSSGDITEIAIIQSIELPEADDVISIHENVLQGGHALKAGDAHSVLVGKSLAKNLELEPGDTFEMISQCFDGSIAAERFTIAGLLSTGTPLKDSTLVLVPHEKAVKAFAMGDFINSMVIKLAPGTDAKETALQLKEAAADEYLEFSTWQNLIPEIAQFVVLDRIAGYIFSFILFSVVAFTILNTIQMAVFERTHEFGVLMAIGTRSERIFSMVMFESIFITIIALIPGVLLGLGVSTIVEHHPFDYSRFAGEFAVWGVYTTVYPAKATALNVIVTFFLILSLAGIFSIFPARRAMNLKPVEAMRQK